MRICKCEDRHSNIYIKLYILALLPKDASVFIRLSQGINSVLSFSLPQGIFALLLGIVSEMSKSGGPIKSNWYISVGVGMLFSSSCGEPVQGNVWVSLAVRDN